MSFLNPAVLFGLLAVGAPILIHLLNKTRLKRIPWAAMRFLLESVKENNRKLRLRDLILLIARCLAVLLLILAFARPALMGEGDSSTYNLGPVTTAIVLDVSASMGKSDGVRTRFEASKAAILETLDQFRAGSSVAFFTVSDHASPRIAQPTQDFSMVRRSLQAVELTNRKEDLVAGLRAAYEAIAPFTGQPREVHLHTDGQQTAWENQEAIRELQNQYPDIRLVPFFSGAQGGNNTAVTSLQSGVQMPVVGEPITLTGRVTNFGTQPLSSVRATLRIDDAPPSDQAVINQLAPGESADVTFTTSFSSPGFRTVTVSIPADRLPVDNSRSLALNVVERIRALIIDDSTAPSLYDRNDFFLGHALVPVPPEARDRFFIQTTTSPSSVLSSTELAKFNAIFLSNPGTLRDTSAAALRDFVLAGGTLFVFPGSDTTAATFGTHPELAAILPVSYGDPVDASKAPVRWTRRELNHPVTALWQDAAQGDLTSIQFNRFFPMTVNPEANPPPEILASLENGNPAVVLGRAGAGHTVFFAGPATTDMGNLPVHPIFVALLHRILAHTTADAAPSAIQPGQTFLMPVATELIGKPFLVAFPNTSEKKTAGQIDLIDGRAVIRYRETDRAGAHRLFVEGSSEPIAAFSVQIDPAESDLRAIDPALLASLQEPPPQTEASAQTQNFAIRSVVRQEFWTVLIWMVAVLALCEFALAHHFSRLH